jgi:uncharacterized protein YfaT (DUF1175 family)
MGSGTVFLFALWTLGASPAELRREVATVALAQAQKPDPAWHPQQRDCAGLVRFAYRVAYSKWNKTTEPLWRDANGTRVPFADAETLLAESFVLLGRDERAELSAQSGDLLAFRTEDETFHLMIYVRGEDRARTPSLVVYSPGDGSSDVRVGNVRELKIKAPVEWRPVASNPRFLGFYRFKEWMSNDD